MFRASGTPLTLALATSMLLLIGCESARVALVCPGLSDPPLSVVDALEAAGRKDPSAAAWTVHLADHYDKLDACRNVR